MLIYIGIWQDIADNVIYSLALFTQYFIFGSQRHFYSEGKSTMIAVNFVRERDSNISFGCILVTQYVLLIFIAME